MGLDMMAQKVRKEEIASWRKHNRLHGWMESRWRKLGNEGIFNSGAFLYLDLDLLNQLEKAIKNNGLPATSGFFFGDDSYQWDEDGTTKIKDRMKKEDLKFIKKAKQAIKDGYDVEYSSWW